MSEPTKIADLKPDPRNARKHNPRVSLTCPVCGKSFGVRSYRVAEGAKYCSVACAHRSPEWSAHLSESLRRAEPNPDAIAKMRATCQTEAVRKARGRSTREAWADPDKRARLMAGIKARSDSQDWKQKQRAGSARRSDGEEWQERNRHKRRKETDIERLLYEGLQGMGVPVLCQYPFGRFTPDFALPDRKLFIMADGAYWHSLARNVDCDARFERQASEDGWRVLRFSDKEIKTDLSTVLETVRQYVES